jgi:hypothetical protein
MRKEIKFAMKRGVQAEGLKKILLGEFGSAHKTLIKS